MVVLIMPECLGTSVFELWKEEPFRTRFQSQASNVCFYNARMLGDACFGALEGRDPSGPGFKAEPQIDVFMIPECSGTSVLELWKEGTPQDQVSKPSLKLMFL